jgi:flavin-dependent dehydrogenase
VKKVGVLGAGMMGAGIALVSAMAGMEVVLIDQKQEAADKGKAYTADYMDKGIKRGKATEAKKEARWRRSPPPPITRRCGLRPDHRGGVRGPEGEGRGDQTGARRRPR